MITCYPGETCNIFCDVIGACHYNWTVVVCYGTCNIYCISNQMQDPLTREKYCITQDNIDALSKDYCPLVVKLTDSARVEIKNITVNYNYSI